MLYGQRSDGAFVAYEGMPMEVVEQMLATQSLTINWLTLDQYTSALPKVI